MASAQKDLNYQAQSLIYNLFFGGDHYLGNCSCLINVYTFILMY